MDDEHTLSMRNQVFVYSCETYLNQYIFCWQEGVSDRGVVEPFSSVTSRRVQATKGSLLRKWTIVLIVLDNRKCIEWH